MSEAWRRQLIKGGNGNDSETGTAHMDTQNEVWQCWKDKHDKQFSFHHLHYSHQDIINPDMINSESCDKMTGDALELTTEIDLSEPITRFERQSLCMLDQICDRGHELRAEKPDDHHRRERHRSAWRSSGSCFCFIWGGAITRSADTRACARHSHVFIGW